MFGYVYKVTNVDTGSFYIGKHKYKSDESFMDYLGSSSHPDFDLNKYDRKCFVKEKLADAETEQDLYNLERQYILDSLDKPGNVNSIKGVGYGGQYNYSDSDWALKSTPNVEYVAYCESCGKMTTHYKNGACKGCTAKISYNNSDAKSYFKKSYQLKYCPVCQKETKHSGKDFTNCASCYNSKGYNLYKHDGKISLRNGTNIIIDDVTFILDVIKEGNSFTLPKGVTVTDGTSKTNVIKFIKNSDVCNWMSLDLVSSTGWHQTITVTTDHPFVTERSDFVKAEDLTVDDVLLTSDNRPVHIRAITMLDRIADSYDLETESGFFNFSNVRSRNCRTRVISDITDPDNQIVTGRGNLSFTSINLPRLAIESNGNIDKFYQSLDEIMEIVKNQLLHRYKIQCNKTIKNYPFLMGQGAWMHSDELGIDDNLESVLKHGTLSIGFIGLAETLKALIGKHHGESETAQKLGLEIIKHMRDYTDKMSTDYNLNFSLLATPAEGLCLAGDTLVQTPYGNVPIKDIKDGDLVFSYNLDTNKVELDTVAKSWMTSPSRQVMKITFDTGQEVVCTPNHPFAVRKICRGEHGKVVSVNGSNEYIEFVNAENLEVGMRIKSNYIESSASGHLRFKNTNQYIHKMVYEHFTNQPIPNGYVVHHKDENELNNYFDNLELLSDKEHRIHHLKDTIGKCQYKSENVMGKDNPFYGKHHSDETKQLIRDSKKLNKFKFELVSAYYSGSTYSDLAEKYDVSTKAICNKLKQCGVVLQKNHIITKIEYLDEPIPVYDLTMTKNSNFFVGGNRGILVHNSGRFVKMDKERFGIIEGVTDRDYYTNSSHK